MNENILQFSPWKIEQHEWAPESENEINKQMTFSNGYISQYGFLEEHFSSEAAAETFLRGIQSPLPTSNILSVRLHEDRVDLAVWKVLNFYRCLHRQEPLLERCATVENAEGKQLEISSKRLLSTEDLHAMQNDYEVRSINYNGPISFLALLGDPASEEYWYPLHTEVESDYATVYLQSRSENVQVVYAFRYVLLKNGQPVKANPIRIEKQFLVGYSQTEQIAQGDVFTLRISKYVTDSRNFPLTDLNAAAVAAITKTEE